MNVVRHEAKRINVERMDRALCPKNLKQKGSEFGVREDRFALLATDGQEINLAAKVRRSMKAMGFAAKRLRHKCTC